MDDYLLIRLLTEVDLDVANDILNAAYDSDSDRGGRLRRYLSLQPDGWLLALLDGRPVGIGGAVNYGPFASIGSIGVHPEAQRRGIGRALMERLLSWLDVAGCRTSVLIATDAGAPLYRHLGFVEDDRTLIYPYAGAEHAPQPLPASTAVSTLDPAELAEIAAFDAPIFGAPRQRVLASYFAADPARVLVTHDREGHISGYLCAQQTTLGPWAARTPEDAEVLLERALSLPFESAPRVMVPAANESAAHLLPRYGFGPPHALQHMRRGETAVPSRPGMLYGHASFAIG